MVFYDYFVLVDVMNKVDRVWQKLKIKRYQMSDNVSDKEGTMWKTDVIAPGSMQ